MARVDESTDAHRGVGQQTRGDTPSTPLPKRHSTPARSAIPHRNIPSTPTPSWPRQHHQRQPCSLLLPSTSAFAPASALSSSCLASPSSQQEPGSAQYIARVFRLARSSSVPWSQKSPMADFLASFNFQSQAPAQTDSRPCNSIDELQSRLRELFDAKVTETRAERVTAGLYLAGGAQLTLGLSDGENEVLEGLNNIDPSLGGVRSTSLAADRTGSEAARVVSVSDALINQPSDEPVLQRYVAKVIITGINAVDGSEWTVPEVSRDTQGWVFSYLCQGSVQHWERQHKSQPKAIIGEYSQRELDPYLGGRPAFDCRGSIIVSFLRDEKAISIKYDHTPLHKTVAELAEYFKPAPPDYPAPAQEKQKTPKTIKTPKAPKTPKTPRPPGSGRKKRDAGNNPRDSAQPSKKKKSTGNANITEAAGTGESSQPSPSQNAGVTQPDDGAEQLQALVENGTNTQRPQAGQVPVTALTINVSPEEAERRRGVANIMLRDAGVDPDTLSTEQFNIFANQSPDLQKESLSMLVKYGAERLRIVHPGSKEGSTAPPNNKTSAETTPSNIQTSPSGPVTTNELVLQKGMANGKRKSINNGDIATEDSDALDTPKTRRRGPTKSRVACFQCKERKVKCPKNMPTCTECQSAGIACEFPPPKPRKKKSNAIITAEDEQDEDTRGEEDVGPEAPTYDESAIPDDERIYSEVHDGSVHNQMAVADLLTANVSDWGASNNPPDYLHPSTSLAMLETTLSQASHSPSTASSGLMLPQGRMHYPQIPGTEASEQPVGHTMSPKQSKSPASTSTPGNIPGGSKRPRPENRQSSPSSQTTADWSSGGSQVAHTPGDGQQGINTSQQLTVMQRHGAKSPLNNVPRTKSRQGNSGSRSSLQNDPLVNPSLTARQSTNAGGARQTAANYDSYERYSENRPATDTPSGSRITYEPYSYQRASDTVAYGNHGPNAVHSTTSTVSMPNQTTNVMTSDHSNSRHYNPYSSQQTQNTNHSNTSHLDSRQNPSSRSKSNEQSHTTRQNFGMRSQDSNTRSNLVTMKQSSERSYSQYPSPQQPQQHQNRQSPQHAQQSNQSQQWYNFNNQGSGSFSSATHGSNYSWGMPGDP